MDIQQALQNTKFAPYWTDTLACTAPQSPLSGDIECDLLIVGGGFCGLWGAIQAKEMNPERHVVLIEAESVARGASGRPAGIISTSLMHGIHNSERCYSEQEVARLEEYGRENIDQMLETIERYQIDCDLELSGELTVAVGKEGLPDIEHEAHLYQKYGHEAVSLDKAKMQAEVASPLFEAGVWCTKRSGTVHPGKLCTELKRVALDLGVELYEQTPLVSHKKIKQGVRVETPSHTIDARKVLLATNAFEIKRTKIHRKVVSIRDRILMTEPLTEEQLARVGWKNRQGIYDTRTQLNYMRLTKDNRILFGGRLGYYYGNNTDPQGDKCAEPFEPLVAIFHKTFPMLNDVSFSHAWSGPIALTTRMAVHFQTYYGGDMIYAGGYSGFGITATRFGARIGLALLDKENFPALNMSFVKTQPNYVPPEPLRWIGTQLSLYALDTCDEKGGWRKPWVNFVAAMGFPIVK